MQLLKRTKNIFFALLPIMVIVLFVHLFFYKFDTSILVSFFVAVIFICIGETLFLTGVDSTIMPMGDLMVGAVNKASKFVIFILFAVVFGFCATIAEPDVTVFSAQVMMTGVKVSRSLLIFFIGAGVGVFVAIGVIRIIKNINLKYVYILMFALIFLLCTQVKSEYIAIAFDAGGATTGIVTAPFLLAISSGVSSKFNKESKSNEVFGMLGLASLGPIIAVLMYFWLFQGRGTTSVVLNENVNIYLNVLKNASLAILPLALVFLIYDLCFIKLPARRKFSFALGLLVTFVGLALFLFGIDYGIEKMGYEIGKFISGLNIPLVVVFCVCLGFIITFAEPSVIVLARQVQNATKGNISYLVVVISIAISMSIAILLSALKIVYSINFFYIILAGYLVALLLMFVVPSIFTNLAFDSGGVASGPMTSAFILPIMLAFATEVAGGAVNGFGLIGIVSMCPIVVLQLLGLVYKVELKHKDIQDEKRLINLAYTMDMYSNISELEDEYNEMRRNKGEKQ